MVETNLNTLTLGQFEDFNNAGRFFNDTTLTLDLVAFRLGAIIDAFPFITNVPMILKIYGVVELSRQAQIFQQEGILGSVRATNTQWAKVDANGGMGAQNMTVGEMIYGDFKTKLMTLEQQTNIFLNGRIISSGQSGDVLTTLLGELQGGATCYFKRRGRR